MTREEAIAKINILRNEYNDRYIDYCGVNEAVNMAIEALKAEPVRGRWLKTPEEDGVVSGICSECGWEAEYYADDVAGMPYCPNCGAKMEESDETD